MDLVLVALVFFFLFLFNSHLIIVIILFGLQFYTICLYVHYEEVKDKKFHILSLVRLRKVDNYEKHYNKMNSNEMNSKMKKKTKPQQQKKQKPQQHYEKKLNKHFTLGI